MIFLGVKQQFRNRSCKNWWCFTCDVFELMIYETGNRKNINIKFLMKFCCYQGHYRVIFTYDRDSIINIEHFTAFGLVLDQSKYSALVSSIG